MWLAFFRSSISVDFHWFICSCQLFSYEQKREINSHFERSGIKRKHNHSEENKMAKNQIPVCFDLGGTLMQ